MKKGLTQRDTGSLDERTRQLLRRYGLRARKGLGQHFLTDEKVLDTILEAAALTPDDTVIEVGPGLGILTAELVKRTGCVIAVELDDTLSGILKENLELDHLTVVNADILNIDIAGLLNPGSPRYKVVANLPYYITSPVLRYFLEAAVRPQKMVVMVQREVAGAITAGRGRNSLLGISVQFYGNPVLVATVPADSFYPRPEVDSAIISIDVYAKPAVDVDDVEEFFRVVHAGFIASRKQLINSLAMGLGISRNKSSDLLQRSGIAPQRRAETLTLEEWAALWRAWSGKNE